MAGLILVVAVPRSVDPVHALASELRCPDCQALSVAESRTAASVAIRREIASQLAAGRSADEVRRYFVDRYGEWILLRPASPLAWLVPILAVAAAGAALAWWLRRRDATTRPVPPPVDAATRRRLAEETEALDG